MGTRNIALIHINEGIVCFSYKNFAYVYTRSKGHHSKNSKYKSRKIVNQAEISIWSNEKHLFCVVSVIMLAIDLLL
jgi:hypothetical protein